MVDMQATWGSELGDAAKEARNEKRKAEFVLPFEKDPPRPPAKKQK